MISLSSYIQIFFAVEYLLSVVGKDTILATVLWDQVQHAQSLFSQLTNILTLTLLPAKVVSAWPTHFFCNSQELCFTEDLSCDVEGEWSQSPLLSQCILSLSFCQSTSHFICSFAYGTKRWWEVEGSFSWSPTGPLLGKVPYMKKSSVTFLLL